MKKAVVTGGLGFIGSHLVEGLLSKGYEVHSVDTATTVRTDRLINNALYHDRDVRDTKAMERIFDGADCVFHEAALPRVQYSIEYPLETSDVNMQGTISVLTAAQRAGVRRVVYAASSSAYGDQERLPLTEDMPALPKSPYGLQKYVGELVCRTWSEVYGIETVALRYFNVYGPRLDPNGPYALVIGKFLKQRKEGVPLTVTGDGEQTRDFTHVSDVVRANLLAMDAPSAGKGEVINIGAGANVTINELVGLIGGPKVHIEARSEPKHTRADGVRARKLLGWKPLVTLPEGIQALKQEWGIV